MKNVHLAFFVIVAWLTLSGCAADGVDDASSQPSALAIGFDAYLGRNIETQSIETNMDFMKGDTYNAGFGVFARYDYQGTQSELMNKVHVKWDKNERKWTYAPLRYWPVQGVIHFYAYAPAGYNGELLNRGNKGSAFIDFDSHSNAVDLLWANAEDMTYTQTQSTQGKVKFAFSHALARIGVNVTARNVVNEDVTIIVNSVKLRSHKTPGVGAFPRKGRLNLSFRKGVDDGKKLLWDLDNYKMDEQYTQGGIYIWQKEWPADNTGYQLVFDGHNNLITPAHPQVGNDNDSWVFVIPHDNSKDGGTVVEVEYTIKQHDYEETFTVSKQLYVNWQYGHAYTLNMNIGGGMDPISFSVSIEDYQLNDVTP